MDIKWIGLNTALAIHREQVAEHGGTDGVRDQGLLESALARRQNLHAYGDNIDLVSLSASYAFGIAKNHPFLDGNKRTALVVAITFLNVNGYDFDAPPSETYSQFLGLAEGIVSEDGLSRWIRERLYPLGT
jgi:death-on-curing protein